MKGRAASGTGELRIEGLGTGGEGVAHVDGKPLFVAGTLPGERVQARWEAHGKHLRAELLRVVEPHPDRKIPECDDASACGGCDWMHMQLEAQWREHAARLERLFATPVGHHEVAPALGTRHRMRLHVRPRGDHVDVGYFRARSTQLLVPARCHAVAPALDTARKAVASTLRPYRDLVGELSLSQAPSGAVVADLELSAGEPSGAAIAAFDALVTTGVLRGLRVVLPHGAALAIGDPTPITEGADGQPLRLAPGGFAQSSPSISRALGTRMLAAIDALALKPDARVFEMHAGAGNFSLLLARRTTRLETFEVSAAAVTAARAALAERGLLAKAHVAAAEAVPIPNRLPLLVLDPPREGAREVMQNARDARVQALVYVSCEPTSLARDRAVLGDAYQLTRLEAFEMFPQTSHVETLASFVRLPG